MQKARVVNLICPKTGPRILNKNEGQGRVKDLHQPRQSTRQVYAPSFFYLKEEHDSLSPPFNAGIAIISQRKILNKGSFFQNLDVIQNLEEKKNSDRVTQESG